MKDRLIIILVVLVMLLTACASDSDKELNPSVTDSTDGVIESAPTDPDPVEEIFPTQAIIEEPTIPVVPTETPSEIVETEVPFEEIVVVDDEEVMIKITGLNPDGFWGYEVKIFLENKSTEKTYMFSVLDAFINGVKADPFFASEVSPGKKENSSLTFDTTTLEKNNIEQFTDFEIIFRVYDSDDWSADDIANETINIFPFGEDKAIKFEREPKESDNVIVDNEYVTVIVTGYEDDPIWGYTANLYLVNKSEKEVMFSVSDAAINGFMVDPFFARSLFPGKSSFSGISWSDSTLEEQGITDIEEIEFLLRVYDYNDYSAADLVNQIVILNP